MEGNSSQHEALAGLAGARNAVTSGLTAVRQRAYGLTDTEVRDGLRDAVRLVAMAQSFALALTKELDTRPDAVPGAVGPNGAKTFLVEALHVDGGKAKASVDCAYALDPDTGDLAHVGQALVNAEVGFDQASVCVRAVARLPKRLKSVTVTDEDTGEQVTGIEAVDRMLARTIPDVPPRGVGWLTDQLLTHLDPDREERFDPDAHTRRGLSLTFDPTGMGVLRAYLPAADAALLKAVLSQLAKPDPQTVCTVQNEDGSVQEEVVRDRRSLPARQYDACMALIRRGLLRGQAAPDNDTGGGAAPSSPPSTALPEVKLVITATAEQAAGLRGSGKATFDRVGPIDARTLSVFTCSATLRRVLTDPRGVPIDVGRAHRLATPALRAALVARDRGCVVPGCTVPADGCDAHHVIAWSNGGRTDLANMVLVWAHHHQAIHDGVYQVEIRDGIPWVRPPVTVDLQRRWRRNPLHHNGARFTRLVEQLTLALADDGRAGDGEPDPRQAAA